VLPPTASTTEIVNAATIASALIPTIAMKRKGEQVSV
jgi:hypothetical protein